MLKRWWTESVFKTLGKLRFPLEQTFIAFCKDRKNKRMVASLYSPFIFHETFKMTSRIVCIAQEVPTWKNFSDKLFKIHFHEFHKYLFYDWFSILFYEWLDDTI